MRNKRIEIGSILDLLYDITKRHSNSPALQMEEPNGIRSVSFDELRERSVDVSASLIKMHIEKGDRVAIFSENRPEWGIALFGIISAAAITVPMDTKLSENEALYIIRNSGARCIFVSKDFLPVVQKLKDRLPSLEYVVCFDDPNDNANVLWMNDFTRQQGDKLNRPEEVKPEGTCLIVYTSGTMGTAKGVELTYGNLLFEVKALYEAITITGRDRFVSILPLNHMLEITGGLIVPLYGGACVTYARSLKPDKLIALMKKTRVTAMICVPLLLKMLHNGIMAEVNRKGAVKRRIFEISLRVSGLLQKINLNPGRILFYPVHARFGRHLRAFVCGGAPLDPLVAKDFNAIGFSVLQGYGLTETSPVVTFNSFKKKKYGSVGIPLKGVEIKIIRNSETGGDEGELIVRGPNVMKGYYNDPQKTSETMRGGWLYTGDIGWMDKDKFLYISGRSKNLIVLGVGKKVFPEEVEDVMMESPYITELCVLGRVAAEGARKGSEEVYAIIVPNFDNFNEAERTDEKAVRARISEEIERLSKNLAEYKKIREFEVMRDALPKTSTRKIKRKALIEYLEKTSKESPKERPDQYIENIESKDDDLTTKIKKILSGMLAVPAVKIKADSNLYNDFGVDSLMKVELLCALEKEFGLEIPDEIAYEMNTFGDIVRIISEYMAGRVDDVSVSDEEVDSLLRVNIFFRLSRMISAILFRAFSRIYFQLEIRGLDNIPKEGSFIIASSHASMMDFPLLFSCLPFSKTLNVIAPAAQDYFYSSFIKRSLVQLAFNTFAFERFGNFVKGLKICGELIKRGRSIILFPEGTRSARGELSPFKPGIGSLASALGVAVIPTYIHGIFEALPKGAVFPRPRKVTVIFGKPVYANREHKGNMTDYEFYKGIALQVEKRVKDIKVSMANKEGR
ncbi:MAG: AMP-binding protein [bacterium]